MPSETPKKVKIKKPALIDMTGIEGIRKLFGVSIQKEVTLGEIREKKRQNFKNLAKEEQRKLLFIYIKSKSEGGLYKKEGNRVIASHFNVGKDLIGRLLKTLEFESSHICKLNDLDNYYKLLKEEF